MMCFTIFRICKNYTYLWQCDLVGSGYFPSKKYNCIFKWNNIVAGEVVHMSFRRPKDGSPTRSTLSVQQKVVERSWSIWSSWRRGSSALLICHKLHIEVSNANQALDWLKELLMKNCWNCDLCSTHICCFVRYVRVNSVLSRCFV